MTTKTSPPAPISRLPGTALHRQMFVALRDEILRGVYAPGAIIPREEDLCTQFGVSRITVRRAVSDLEAAGLLEKRPPHGTFISASVPQPRASATMGLLDSLRKTADETKVEVLKLETEVPPIDVARQLGLAPNVPAVHVIRVRSRKTTPVMITEAWVPESVGKGVTVTALRKHALYEILIAQGVAFGRVMQEITAVAASPANAKLLHTEVGVPLMRMSRLLYDKERQPVQHLTILFSPERSRILMDVSVDDVNTLAAGTIYHDQAHIAG